MRGGQKKHEKLDASFASTFKNNKTPNSGLNTTKFAHYVQHTLISRYSNSPAIYQFIKGIKPFLFSHHLNLLC